MIGRAECRDVVGKWWSEVKLQLTSCTHVRVTEEMLEDMFRNM